MLSFKKLIIASALSLSFMTSFAASICVVTATQGESLNYIVGWYNSPVQGYNSPTGDCYVPGGILPNVHAIQIFLTEPDGTSWQCVSSQYLDATSNWIINVYDHNTIAAFKNGQSVNLGFGNCYQTERKK